MKKIKYFKPVVLVMFGILFFASFYSCEEDEVDYTNQYIIDGDIGLTYTNVDTYTYQKKIVTDAPSFDLDPEDIYRFKLITVTLKDGIAASLDEFDIDSKTGVITIDNSGGKIIPGETYSFNIGVDNVNGTILEANSFVLTVKNIPLDYTITADAVDVEFLDETDVATVTYVDTSTEGDVIEDVTYSLKDAPAGFAIDEKTGVISKDNNATSGVHVLTVIIDSNLGAVTFADVLTVTVGEAPTLQYVQADGTTQLSNVVLSPWTAYTTATPKMEGMTAVKYEIILPATLTDGTVVANADGTISVLANQDLPLGDHVLGVIATNSSDISATFEGVFTLTVEAHWESTPAFSEDFNNASDPVEPQIYNPLLKGYELYSSDAAFTVVHTLNTKPGKEKDLYTLKLSDDKNNLEAPVDAAVVLGLSVQPDWRKMRVSFNEDFGFADNRIDWYDRTLQSSYDVSDLENGTYDPSNWTTVMAANNSNWSGTSGWSGIHVDTDLNKIPAQDVELDAGNDIIYLNWRIQKTGTAEKSAIFLIDEILVEVSKAFAAEEF